MDLLKLMPIMIYDDECYLCGKFAQVVRFFAKDRILIVGHYSDLGIKIKSEIFSDDYDATRMFWFVDGKTAYGGRAAIAPLISSIFTAKIRSDMHARIQTACGTDCKTPKAVFLRTKSLFSNSEKIRL